MKRKFLLSIVTVITLSLALALPVSAHDGVGGDEYAAADSMLVVAILFIAITGIGLLISYLNGEFHHPEQIKRRMIEMAVRTEMGEDVEQYALTEA